MKGVRCMFLRMVFFGVAILSFFVSCKSHHHNLPSDEESSVLRRGSTWGVALFAIRTTISKSRFAFYACPKNVRGEEYRLDVHYRVLCVPLFLNTAYKPTIVHPTHQLEKTTIFAKDSEYSAAAFLLEDPLGEIGSKVLSYVRVDVRMLLGLADQELVMQCKSTLESLHTSIVRDYKNAMFEVDKFCSKHFDTTVRGYLPFVSIFTSGSTKVERYRSVESLSPHLAQFLVDAWGQQSLMEMCLPISHSSKGLVSFKPVCVSRNGKWYWWQLKRYNAWFKYLDSTPHP